MLDDLFTYRLAADRFLTVTNAANHERDLAWFRDHSDRLDVAVTDRLADYAMLAVQGPEARAIVAGLVDGELPPRMRTASLPLDAGLGGAEVLVCGTGYTGEDGVEVLTAPAVGPELWAALLDRGATPAGLGARDTLRLEVCFHLYGNDLSEDRNPIEAGLGWCCVEATGFIGAEAVAAARAGGTLERLAPFALTGPGIPRQGNPVLAAGETGRRGDQRHPLAVARTRDRDGLLALRARRSGYRGRDRRPRADARREGREAPAAGTRPPGLSAARAELDSQLAIGEGSPTSNF